MQFRDEYYFLSNMYPCRVNVFGKEFKCAESAFQAAKAVTKEDFLKFVDLDGFTARKLGRKINLRKDWADIKDKAMFQIVKAKFEQNPELMQKLKSVKTEIQEDNAWGDMYWGVCNGYGQNRLGKMLMYLRDKEN